MEDMEETNFFSSLTSKEDKEQNGGFGGQNSPMEDILRIGLFWTLDTYGLAMCPKFHFAYYIDCSQLDKKLLNDEAIMTQAEEQCFM